MPSWKLPFRKRALDQQFDSEISFHADELAKDYIAAGMTPEEARRRARLELGGSEQIKEELRDVHRIPVLETALNNLKWAFRFIRKSPSFSLVVILTLALGIGANSAVFSAIDAILLRPLPFPDGDQLMELQQINQKAMKSQTRLAPVRLEDWNRLNSTFQAITGYYTEDDSETSGTLPEKIKVAFVAPRFLQVFGVAPALGREFSPAEEQFGGPNAILISDGFWRRRFGGDPNTVGKQLRIHDTSLNIVGIMPPSFAFPDRDTEIWLPVPANAPYAQSREYTWYRVVGRVKPGVTLAQARANLDAVQSQLGKQYPQTDADLAVEIQSLKETIVGDARKSLWLLFGSVTLLLLIACTNVVALLVARGTQRQHEISVRFSLGAPRIALIWQLLTETFVLALAGAAVGLFVAGAASRTFRALASDLPRVEEIHLDWRIVLYSLLCSVIVTLLSGVLPALRGSRQAISTALAHGRRTQVSSHAPLQRLLVGIQVALAIALLSGAGLLLRSFQALGRVSPGFDPSHVVTFHISGSYGETVDWRALTQRVDREIEGVRALPGVESAAASATLPGVPTNYPTELRFVEGEQDPHHKMVAESRFVTPGYFATMKIPLLSGEVCREPQFKAVPSKYSPTGQILKPISMNVLVNRSFADTYLSGSAVLGRHLQVLDNSFMKPDQTGEIRGVVGNAREEGIHRLPSPTVYWCAGAPGGPDAFFLVRTLTAPMSLAKALRERIRSIEPARSVFDVSLLQDKIDEAFAEDRLRTVLLSFFAVTAVALACVGLYGTLSYSVSTRQREIGLRLALGALRVDIVQKFLLQGLGITVLGCIAGLLLAAAGTHFIASMLYGVSPSDVATSCTVVLLMLLVAASAALVPAIRAARVDPMQVLREE